MSFLNSEQQDTTRASARYEVVTDNKRVVEVVKKLKQRKVIAVDSENTGLDEHVDNPLLLQIGTSDFCYIFHTYDPDLDIEPIKELLEDPSILKVLFNAKYDYRWMYAKFGISMTNIFCSQVGEMVLRAGLYRAGDRPSLAKVARNYLGIELKKQVRNSFVGRDPIASPITEEEYQYAADDVIILPDICYQQVAKAQEYSLENTFALEMGVLPAVAEAESIGCLLDVSLWKERLKVAKERHAKIGKEIFKHFEPVVAQKNLFGLPLFNLGSTEQLKKNLAKLGFNLDDTNEGVLKKYKKEHSVFSLLLRYRGYSKIISSYGEKLLGKINKKSGRLHANFNQVETQTGRMSSSKPNLQQIPGFDPEDEDSLDFRSCFVARPGYKLVTADFSQQELRILAELSGDPTFLKAYTEKDANGNTLDVHKYTASVIFETPYEEVTSIERKKAKTLNFFLVYGGGSFALAETLGCTPDEAQETIDDYFRRYSKIKKYLDRMANLAVNKGYSETIVGRKRFMPLPPQDAGDFEKIKKKIKRQGKNTPIQGSGADVTKQAMIFLYNALRDGGFDAQIIMVVHDEIVVEVREDQANEVAKVVEREMVRGFSHFFKKIPMVVDAHIGNTWEK